MDRAPERKGESDFLEGKEERERLARLRLEIRNQYLFISFPGFFLCGVVQIDSLNVKVSKEFPDLRHVIQ